MKASNILILAVLLASCNSQEKDTKQTNSQNLDKEKPSSTNCYLYAVAADTVSLKVSHVGDSVSGYLVYNYKEKDKNTGTIRGRVKDNILLAEYTYLSEGVQSCRQVAFKLKGDSFFEGYGESYNKKDRAFFKYPDSLNYDNSFKLRKIDCQ